MVARAKLLVMFLVPLCFGAGAVTGAGDVQMQLKKIPEGFRETASAESLAGLKVKAHPTLSYDYKNFHLMFWAKIDGDGKPQFAVATASLLAGTPKHAARWVTFAAPPKADLMELFGDSDVMPRVTVPVVATQPKANCETVWARNLGNKREVGTVYEVAYHMEPCTAMHCYAEEYRLILLHAPDNTWKLLQFIQGGSSNEAEEFNVIVSARWTANAASPLELTVTGESVLRGEDKGVAVRSDEIFTGPLGHMSSREVNYLRVEKGDSFNALTKRFADQEMDTEKPAERNRRFLAALRAEIVRLAPGLDIEHVRPRDRLILPDMQKLKEKFEGK